MSIVKSDPFQAKEKALTPAFKQDGHELELDN